MLDAKEIDIEIARLEYGESSYPAYAKLADLYVIRDQMTRASSYEMAYSATPAQEPTVTDRYGDSDFLLAVAGKDQSDVWAVMDDLMDTLKVANPRVYNRVMARIKGI